MVSTSYFILCPLLILLTHSYNKKKNSNSQLIQLKWQFVFRNASEKVLVSLKLIIHILTVFVTQTYGFRPYRRDLSYNNIITFRYALSPTSLNEILHVLRKISYYIDNILYIRKILTVYQTQLTSIGLTCLNKGTRFFTHT